jgi:hypothetical protein
MARNGSLNRKRQIAAKKRKVNPSTMYIVFVETGGKWKQMRVTENKQIAIDLAEAFSVDGKHAVVEDSVGRLIYDNAIKKNPRKKTVSQKISQLVHEGYPQKQAVAVALNEQRAGKVKRNPASGMVKGFAVVCMHPKPHTVAITTSMADAKKIGQDYATRENVQVAIKPVSVHKAHFA